jgi:periplasmic copper chaperone A
MRLGSPRSLPPATLATRLLVSVGFVAAVVLASATSAGAHVGITGATTTAGITTVEFAWDHGCGSQPTTAIEMRLPPGATVESTTLLAGWEATIQGAEVRIAGPAVADGTSARFSLDLSGFDTSVEHLVPTLQICPDGEQAWIGADPEASDAAPRLSATTEAPPATSTTTAGDAASGDDDAEVTSANDVEATASPASVPWVTIIVAIAAAVVLAVVVLVARARRLAN